MTSTLVSQGTQTLVSMLLVSFCVQTGAANTILAVEMPARCDQRLQLRTIRPLDFGDVRVREKESGFLSVMPDGEVLKSDNVLVRHDPVAGLVEICGTPNQPVAIVLKTPELSVQTHQAGPSPKRITRFLIKGQGIVLNHIDSGRWEGRLSTSGRASLLLGATLVFPVNSIQGPFVSGVILDVLPQ